MKTAIAIAVLSLMVAAGCTSPRGGGVSADEAFTIGTPAFRTTVKQGETESVTVSLNRGKQFKRDVTLEIRASEGISVEPTQALIRGSDTPDVQLRITAARGANLGEYKVHVKGTPQSGEATSTDITVMVVSP